MQKRLNAFCLNYVGYFIFFFIAVQGILLARSAGVLIFQIFFFPLIMALISP